MRIFLATDHAGFELKELVKKWLLEQKYEVSDEGAFELDPTDDYPDFIRFVAQRVAANPDEDKGIIFGASGQGEAMAANRSRHVRATVYYGDNPHIIQLSREHNNANVLSIGARFVKPAEALEMIKLWLTTPFSGEERHARRNAKLDHQEHGLHQF